MRATAKGHILHFSAFCLHVMPSTFSSFLMDEKTLNSSLSMRIMLSKNQGGMTNLDGFIHPTVS